jgi:hypothetical protein
VKHSSADERDTNTALVGCRNRPVRHRDGQRGLQPAERGLRADLLQRQHVWLLTIDHGPQRLDLRRELGLGLRAVLVTDVEQVLDVPRHHPKLPHAAIPFTCSVEASPRGRVAG